MIDRSRTSAGSQRAEMLRLVALSFGRELASYGVDRQDIVRASVHLLDYAMGADGAAVDATEDRPVFLPEEVVRAPGDLLRYKTASIRPLHLQHLEAVLTWLTTTDVQRSFAVAFPLDLDGLRRHLFETPEHLYFGMFFQDAFVGLIGGEQIDPVSRKLEMKKFIGDIGNRGRGIGTTTTFLWLHYVFDVLAFNKVYIYSLDTNIRNINLNRRLGFTLEGVLRQDVAVGEEYRDVLRMSLLRSRWREMFRVPQTPGIASARS